MVVVESSVSKMDIVYNNVNDDDNNDDDNGEHMMMKKPNPAILEILDPLHRSLLNNNLQFEQGK